jgi:hypothetical protein
LISGEDCAIAGEATAVAAAPAAETFKKSRRFIKSSPCWGVSQLTGNPAATSNSIQTEGGPLGGLTLSNLGFEAVAPRLNTEVQPRKRGNGMAALNESRTVSRFEVREAFAAPPTRTPETKATGE